MSTRVISWDWREQIDLDALRGALLALSDNKLRLYEVDTQSDQYAIVLSNEPLQRNELPRIYGAHWSAE